MRPHGGSCRELKNRPRSGRFDGRGGGARLVNNAYGVLGRAHDPTSLSQPSRPVNQGCAPAAATPRGAD